MKKNKLLVTVFSALLILLAILLLSCNEEGPSVKTEATEITSAGEITPDPVKYQVVHR